MKKATLAEVQVSLGEYVKTSVRQPVLILHDGEPVAVLVGIGQGKKRVPVKLRDVLQRAWMDYEKHGGTPHERFWEEMAAERPGGREGRRTKG
jgi:antitoxin (DNA-binding transcriptional repressor) of toxin-antitoxin stability system